VFGTLIGSLCLATRADGQRVEALSDAATLPAGSIRITLGGTHRTQRDRYRDGILEPLGAPLTAAALGPSHFPLLGTIETEVRALGLPAFAASLGTSRLDARQRLFVTPLAVEYGLTRWLTLGARTSLVRTKAEALFRIRGDSGRATLGPNPIFIGSSVPASNLATINTYFSASGSLFTRRDACLANAGANPDCPTILAELAQVNALISGTSAFATGLSLVYGAGSSSGMPYVPLEGSPAELALLARVDSIRTALERYGVTDVTATTGLPLGAQAPLAAADLATLVTDPQGGFGAKPITQGGLTAIGDVDLSALLLLHDGLRCSGTAPCQRRGFALRQSVLVQYQLGTGTHPRSDRLLDQGTGSGFDALTLRSTTEVALGPRFGGTISVGATTFQADDVRMRVPSVAFPGYLEAWRDTLVTVTPGLTVDLGVSPRMRLGESFTIGGDWRLVVQQEGRHEISGTVTDPFGALVALSGAALDSLSRSTAQFAGLSIGYSMLPALARGLRRPPVELQFTHQQVLFGHEGIVVKQWEDRVTVRYYTRLRGR
jgi:hypothetical protein